MSRSRAVAARNVVVAAGAAAMAANLLPSLGCITPLRRRVLPSLAGVSDRHHIALTFDDGPDRRTTPRFLELLENRGVTATFFLLAAHAEREPVLVREMVDAGHELAVHGWAHDCLALRPPGSLRRELLRAREVIEDVSGTEVGWYRPPYGVMTGEGLHAAGRAGLQTVLWSSWGVDWSARATPASIVSTVSRSVRPGGTVLLHDTDRTSAPGSWRRTLAATGALLERWARADVLVGPLREHW
ncbi:MAG: polysaccharide deacetylase [Marmoricola sp.]|jgi:peptidoglycan/xylan/chitin deacetylase (PgdA/CDA1 family)|nr:polysaccharide deacetylase [Marmoricola sp.]